MGLLHQESLGEEEPLVAQEWEFLALRQGYVSLILQDNDLEGDLTH